MKSSIYALTMALLLCAGLAGCGTVQQESAMEWMQRQPMVTDP